MGFGRCVASGAGWRTGCIPVWQHRARVRSGAVQHPPAGIPAPRRPCHGFPPSPALHTGPLSRCQRVELQAPAHLPTGEAAPVQLGTLLRTRWPRCPVLHNHNRHHLSGQKRTVPCNYRRASPNAFGGQVLAPGQPVKSRGTAYTSSWHKCTHICVAVLIAAPSAPAAQTPLLRHASPCMQAPAP